MRLNRDDVSKAFETDFSEIISSMCQKRIIEAASGSVEEAQALDVVERAAPDVACHVTNLLFYPYQWLYFDCELKTLIGKHRFEASCLVDLITGSAATTDLFELQSTRARDTSILCPSTELTKAEQIGERYLMHAIRQHKRSLFVPRVRRVRQSQTIYVPFWLISCTSDDAVFETIVNSVSGEHCVA